MSNFNCATLSLGPHLFITGKAPLPVPTTRRWHLHGIPSSNDSGCWSSPPRTQRRRNNPDADGHGRTPTENSLAQATWASDQLSGLNVDVRHFQVPRNFEADAWQSFS